MTPKEAHDLLFSKGSQCIVGTNEWLTLQNNSKGIMQITLNQKFYVHIRVAKKVNLVHYETKEKTFSHYEWQEYRETKGKIKTWKEDSSYGWYNSIEEMAQDILPLVEMVQSL